MNKPFNYIEEAQVTASQSFHGDKVPLAHLRDVLVTAISTLEELDKIKKALYYGRDYPDMPEVGDASDCALVPNMNFGSDLSRDDVVDLVHGIVGKATEAGELLEALLLTVFGGKDFDLVNAMEEVGDGHWYDALIAKVCNTDFDMIQRTNIAKLRLRFPNKFTEYDAKNRNLNAERDILEGKEGV